MGPTIKFSDKGENWGAELGGGGGRCGTPGLLLLIAQRGGRVAGLPRARGGSVLEEE